MSLSWTKLVVSGFATLSLAIALVASVFSQSHAALTRDMPADTERPCAEHAETAGSPVAEDACESLCYSADLNHLLGVYVEKKSSRALVAVQISYYTPPLQDKNFRFVCLGCDLYGGASTYLITHRLRL